MIDDPSLIVNTQDLAEPEFLTATVGAVKLTGLTLIFPGQTEASQKTYRCNSAYNFCPGMRVRVKYDSGTYLVEYPIGTPSLYRRVSFQYNKQNNGSVTWGDDKISVSFTNTNYSGVDICTANPIDLTGISEIRYLINWTAFSDSHGIYIGAVAEKLSGSTVDPWDSYFSALTKLTQKDTGRRIHTVDVSALSGEFYICSHAYSQTYDIERIEIN